MLPRQCIIERQFHLLSIKMMIVKQWLITKEKAVKKFRSLIAGAILGRLNGEEPLWLKLLLILQGFSHTKNFCIDFAFQSVLHCYDQLCTAIWLLRHF